MIDSAWAEHQELCSCLLSAALQLERNLRIEFLKLSNMWDFTPKDGFIILGSGSQCWQLRPSGSEYNTGTCSYELSGSGLPIPVQCNGLLQCFHMRKGVSSPLLKLHFWVMGCPVQPESLRLTSFAEIITEDS